MKKIIVKGFAYGFVITCMAGCHVSQVAQTEPNKQQGQAQKENFSQNPKSDETSQIKDAATVSQILAGKVMETMDAAGYTYILIEKNGNKNWVAVPSAQVVVGQDVQVQPGMEMAQFTSKTLNRTFERIIFSGGVVTEANLKMPEGHPKTSPDKQLPEGHPKNPSANQMPNDHPKTPGSQTPGTASGMAAMLGSGGGEAMGGTLTGKVLETINSGGYTYISLEKEGKKTWVAIPSMKVAVGEELELQQGAPMTNFTSKSLNRTFDSVIFSGGPINKK
ncbi:MAG TPA: hypothetical protein VGJ93_00985 [Desulfuromonadaceae bacterium]|jgi:hypothetical protein